MTGVQHGAARRRPWVPGLVWLWLGLPVLDLVVVAPSLASFVASMVEE